MDSITNLRKVGGSLVATVPKDLVALEGLTEGQAVKISVTRLKRSFLGCARGIGSFTAEDESWMEGRD